MQSMEKITGNVSACLGLSLRSINYLRYESCHAGSCDLANPVGKREGQRNALRVGVTFAVAFVITLLTSLSFGNTPPVI